MFDDCVCGSFDQRRIGISSKVLEIGGELWCFQGIFKLEFKAENRLRTKSVFGNSRLIIPAEVFPSVTLQ